MKEYLIYLITNKINGKVYVGKTDNPTKRWRDHVERAYCGRPRERFYVHHAIAKYGVENFTFEIIEKHETAEEMREAEIFFIAYLKSLGAQLYNQTDGGEGCNGRVVSQVTRDKISKSHMGINHTEETKLKISIENKQRFLDPEYRERNKKQLQENAKNRSGEKSNFSKLKSEDVISIRSKYSEGISIDDLSTEYDVTRTNIKMIIDRKTWKNLP